MTDLADIIASAITPMIDAIVEHDRRLGASDWRGKVTDVDASKKLARIEIGKDEDGKPVKSPWVPYSQTAGALKVHSPPSVGQVMTVRSSAGDIEQGSLEPFHWSDDNKSPSDNADDHTLTFGGVKIVLTSDGITITGNLVVKGNADFDEGYLKAHGTNVGHDHKHKDVMPGSDLTGEPT